MDWEDDQINRAKTIEGKITLNDGSESSFSITTDMGWQQWGADTERLGRSVDIVNALLNGVQDADLMVEEEDTYGL